MSRQIIASESFSSANKTYFLDYSLAENRSTYIRISRSDLGPDGERHRSQVVIFEEDFHFLISAFASLFQSARYHAEGHQHGKAIDESLPDIKGIKSWEAAERPREKLMAGDAESLDNAELLAILLGSGMPGETSVGLAFRILASVRGNLDRLARLKLEEFLRFKGMGVAKSCSVLAAFELGRRTFG